MPREMIATSMASWTLSCQNGRDMLLQHEWYSSGKVVEPGNPMVVCSSRKLQHNSGWEQLLLNVSCISIS